MKLQSYFGLIKYCFFNLYPHLKSYIKQVNQEYNKQQVIHLISQIQSVESDNSSNIEVVSVTSRQDYYMLVLSLKSLFLHSRENFSVLIFDDGSLRTKDIKFIKQNIIGAKVIKKNRYDKRLAKYSKTIFLNKRIRNSPYVIKELGPIIFSKKNKLLFLDSDVLFFKQPNSIIDWIKGKHDIIFLSDYQNVYCLSNIESKYLFNLPLTPKVNSGLIGIHRRYLDQNLLKKLLSFYSTEGKFRLQALQTFFALLISKYKKNKKVFMLHKNYVVGQDGHQNYPNAVCIHFVGLIREKYHHAALVASDILKNAQKLSQTDE